MDGNEMPGPDPFGVPPEAVTIGQVYMATQMLVTRIAIQNQELAALRKEVQEQRADTRDIVAAWKAGGTLIGLAKIITIVAAAIGGAFALFKFWG
jgi:hypothetical protein